MNHANTTYRFASVLILGAVPCLLMMACSGFSVPADPGLRAKMYGSASDGAAAPVAATATRTAVADEGARTLYLNHCGTCHEPFDPRSMAAGDWPRFVRKYGPRAGLFGTNRARVLAWLQANAR